MPKKPNKKRKPRSKESANRKSDLAGAASTRSEASRVTSKDTNQKASSSSPPRLGFGRAVVVLCALALLALVGWLLGKRYQASRLVGQAESALAAHQFSRADILLQQAGDWHPLSGKASLLRGRTARLRGQLSEMQEHLDAAKQEGITNDLSRRELLLADIQSGAAFDLSGKMQRMLAEVPGDETAVMEAFVLGFLAIGDGANANELADQWIDVDETSALPVFYKGRVMFDSERYPLARELYQKALQLNPYLVDARNGLGQVAYALDEPDEALRHFSAVVDADPDDLNARLAKANLLMTIRKYDQAKPDFEYVLKNDPENFSARFVWGAHLSRNDQPKEAVDLIRPTMDQFGDDVALNYLLANSYQQLGQVELARRHLEKHLAARKSLDRLNALEEQLSVRAGTAAEIKALGLGYLKYEWEAAEQFLNQAMKVNPRDPEVLDAMSELYRKLGDAQSARVYANSADLLRNSDRP